MMASISFDTGSSAIRTDGSPTHTIYTGDDPPDAVTMRVIDLLGGSS
jgi:hypothetical protein